MLSHSSLHPAILTLPKAPFLFLSTPRQNFKTKCLYYDRTLCSYSTGKSHFGAKPEERLPKFQSFADFIHDGSLAVWLQSSCGPNDVHKVQALMLKCLGFADVYTGNNLISWYARYGRIYEARKVFDEIPERIRNVITWTAMINGYVERRLDDEALALFHEAISNGVRPTCKTYVCMLNLCSKRLDFELGKQVHGSLVKYNRRNLIVDSSVVHLYAQCGDLDGAIGMFDRMYEHDVVSWTTMISACSRGGHGNEALSMFSRMLSDGLLPNEHTVCSALNACSEVEELKFGKQLHGTIVKRMIKSDFFVWTSLVDMYAKCGQIIDARKIFDGMKKRNTVTWTSIIAGYAKNGLGEEAIKLFREMKRRNVFTNDLTIVSILLACGSIKSLPLGAEIHAVIIKKSIEMNICIGSTLVWFYCKCGKYSAASSVLHQMPFRDVVSWTAIISGFTKLGLEGEALERLKDMLEEGVEPNSFTYSSALKACAKLEIVLSGKQLHSSAKKTPSLSNIYVGSALLNMYAKCGHMSDAVRVFDSMPERNMVTFKSMILGYARNGLCKEALKLMYRMRDEGIKVDDYVVSTVLSACGDVQWDGEGRDASCGYSLQSS